MQHKALHFTKELDVQYWIICLWLWCSLLYFCIYLSLVLLLICYNLLISLGTIFDFDELLEFAKLGCYLQYDLFGTESSYYQLNSSVDMISDGQRIENIMKLINEGLVDRLLMSHDIHTKHRLVRHIMSWVYLCAITTCSISLRQPTVDMATITYRWTYCLECSSEE